MKYTYKDWEGKQRWTRGEFLGWHGPTGILNAYYAEFKRPRSSLFIPAYCLTPETRAAIAPRPDLAVK